DVEQLASYFKRAFAVIQEVMAAASGRWSAHRAIEQAKAFYAEQEKLRKQQEAIAEVEERRERRLKTFARRQKQDAQELTAELKKTNDEIAKPVTPPGGGIGDAFDEAKKRVEDLRRELSSLQSSLRLESVSGAIEDALKVGDTASLSALMREFEDATREG